MKRFFAFTLLLVFLLAPLPAFAHDVEYHPGPLKQDALSDPVINCDVTYHFEGHSYRWQYRMVGNYFHGVSDGDNGWLRSFCRVAAAEDAWGNFKYREGLNPPEGTYFSSGRPAMPDQYLVADRSR